MDRKELEWTLVGLMGLLLVVIAYYVKPLFFLGFVGGPMIIISVFYGYKHRNKMLT